MILGHALCECTVKGESLYFNGALAVCFSTLLGLDPYVFTSLIINDA